jgi:hypothetical protein
MRFKLRTLLGLITVSAVAIAYAMSVAREYHVQLRTVHNLYTAGIDAEWMYFPPRYEVRGLKLSGLVDVPSARHLARLPHLRTLDLDECTVLPEAWETLGTMHRLEELDLSRTTTDDATLEKLRSMTGLRYLQLQQTAVTDGGIERLREALPGLEVYDD